MNNIKRHVIILFLCSIIALMVGSLIFLISHNGKQVTMDSPPDMKEENEPNPIKVGDMDTEIGRFELRNNGGTGDKDIIVTRNKLVLKNIGSLDPEIPDRIIGIIYVGDKEIETFYFPPSPIYKNSMRLKEVMSLDPKKPNTMYLELYQNGKLIDRRKIKEGDFVLPDKKAPSTKEKK